MKKNVSTEKVALLTVWKRKFLSVTVRRVLFSGAEIRLRAPSSELFGPGWKRVGRGGVVTQRDPSESRTTTPTMRPRHA